MFDPTVYENLKVVLEGSVYDLDLAGSIQITARQDLVDLAIMSRTYRLVYQLRNDPGEGEPGSRTDQQPFIEAEIVLSTAISDLAGEILELDSANPGCSIDISFHMPLAAEADPTIICPAVESVLRKVWGERFQVRQTLSQEYGVEPANRTNRISLDFSRRFGEEVVEDIPNILDHTVLTLSELTELTTRP
jgi:hypothetical protein